MKSAESKSKQQKKAPRIDGRHRAVAHAPIVDRSVKRNAPTTVSAKEPFRLYHFDDYKAVIKARVKDLQQRSTGARVGLTLRRLAERIQVQPTYLSRVLNNESAHLSEDQLHTLGRQLEFIPEELDFLQLLRSLQTSGEANRRQQLFQKIDAIRKSRLASADSKPFRMEEFQNEVAYLFTPLAIVVHVALFIKAYQKNPRLLCSQLGISDAALKAILQTLDASDYIVLSDNDPFLILEVKSKYPHFGREHPLMRAHQTTVKTALQSRLNQTTEIDKESFLVTFSMNESGFKKVAEEFRSFVSRVQAISFEGKHTNVYQLGFDFVRWL